MSHRSFARTLVAAAAAVAGAVLLVVPSPAQAVTKLTDAQAASQLSAHGITRSSSGGGTNRNVATCTSYDQINQSTGSGGITHKSASGGAGENTRGTETGPPRGPHSPP